MLGPPTGPAAGPGRQRTTPVWLVPGSTRISPRTLIRDSRVGNHRIRTRGRADPVDSSHVEWTMEWTRCHADGAVLDIRTARHRWRVVSRDDLTEEAARHGFEPVGPTTSTPFLAFQRATGRG